ncbi:MAG TPA: hypothetical protein VJS90_01305 [Pseudomonas sp.]|uniref:hypothetical protein n=1 Tax=Pseudomonas sp. TaxID=306 RepID=UPI002B49AA7E|nr:hypothetical protein [Pseudomonas sp.]HKS11652.1 hypothetical protein [Pseudomonas sp.]
MTAAEFVVLTIANVMFGLLLNKVLKGSSVAVWRVWVSIGYNAFAMGAYLDLLKRDKFLGWQIQPASYPVEVVLAVLTVAMVIFHVWIGLRFRES